MKTSNARLLRQLMEDLRFDANETAFVERQLTAVKTTVYNVLYPDLLAKKFVPLATDIPASADNYVYLVYDTVGEAKVIENGATDLPRVDILGKEIAGKVYTIGDSFGWNVYELQEANRISVPLSAQKAMAARDAIERQVDYMLALGRTASQTGLSVTGLINNADVIANGITAFTNWTAATPPATIVAEITGFINSVVTSTKQKLIPDTLLLPTTRFGIIASMPMGTPSDTTVLQWLLSTSPYLKGVEQWYRLNNAGAANKDRAVLYKRDPLILEGVVPQEFQQFPSELQSLNVVTPCTARCGGVKIYQPSGVLYGDFA